MGMVRDCWKAGVWSDEGKEEDTNGAETITMKSHFLPFRRPKLVLLSATRINLLWVRWGGVDKWDSPGNLQTHSPVQTCPGSQSWTVVPAHFWATLEPFANFRINQKVKQANNNPRAYVSDQLKCWVSPPQKAFHIFTVVLPKWVSTDLLYKAHSQNQTITNFLHTASPPKRVNQEFQ